MCHHRVNIVWVMVNSDWMMHLRLITKAGRGTSWLDGGGQGIRIHTPLVDACGNDNVSQGHTGHMRG
jgi:hypothetical protein